jgi:prophage regulatory protein
MKVLSIREVTDLTGLSRVTVWRMEQKNMFPQRIALSPRRVGWREDEINEWLESLPRVSSDLQSEGV